MYVDEVYYHETFKGEPVDPADFPGLCRRAGEIIEEMTLYRLTEEGFSMMSISIHTSAREVTDNCKANYLDSKISIHTSAREVTYALLSQSQHLPISIHTSAREVTFALRDTFGYDIPISIHTSAREVTEGAFFQCF